MDKSINNRISWLDSCKGFAIMLVVLGHVIDGCLTNGIFIVNESAMRHTFNLIYSFHMPLFFVLSGYIFFKVYCINRVERRKSFILSIMNNIYIYIIQLYTMGVKSINIIGYDKYIVYNKRTYSYTVNSHKLNVVFVCTDFLLSDFLLDRGQGV